MPEVFLGLVPGWGGTQLLPNLIGADNAVTVIVENPLNQNKMLKPEQALRARHRRRAARRGRLPRAVAALGGQGAAGAETVAAARGRPRRRPGTRRWPAGGRWPTRKVHGAAPAPYRALELLALARDGDRDAGFAAEDEALADLVMSDELRAGLYAFDLVQKRAKRPAGAPDKSLARPVTKVGVVGAGLMAGQLALLFVRRLEVPVVLTDLDQERLDRGVGYVHGEIDKLLGKKRIRPDEANRLRRWSPAR